MKEGWTQRKFKHLYKEYSDAGHENEELLSVFLNRGVIKYSESNGMQVHKPSESLEKYQLVLPGCLVLNNQQAWRGSVGVSAYRGIVSPAYHVYTPLDDGLDSRYMNYLARSAMVPTFELCSHGVGSIQRILSKTELANSDVLLPPFGEQHRIADYLDAMCADIDEAIQSAENSISDYKSYLQARLYQMVTKGLDPAVALEKTRLEWIESAPAHWEIAPHKRMMRKIKRLCDHWAGEPVLSLTTNGVIVRDIASGKGKFPATFDGYQYISAGNIVLCLFDVDVTPRCVGLAKQGGVISPAYCQFEMLDGAYAPYYDYYLRAMDDQKLYVHLTSTLRHSFTEDTFGMIPALRPPFEEQVRIAAYLDDFCSNVDRLINAKQSIIDDLKAYKQSLIYEVVTGKKEV